MNEVTKKAIQDLNDSGHTRGNIKNLLNVSWEDIQEVLGKDSRGRKKKETSVKKKAPKKISKEVNEAFNKDETSEKVEIVDILIIDASGSMGAVTDETTHGVRKYISDFKNKAEETGISSKLGMIEFGSKVSVLFEPKEISEDIGNNYVASNSLGMTALRSALSKGLEIARRFNDGIIKRDITITLFTDGGDNAYTQPSFENVEATVLAAKTLGWTIALVGPNTSDTRYFANDVGIDISNVLTYDTSSKEDFVKTYNKMSVSRSVKTDDIKVGKFSNIKYFKEN